MDEKIIIEGLYVYSKNLAKKVKTCAIMTVIGGLMLLSAFPLNWSNDDGLFQLSLIMFPASIVVIAPAAIALIVLGIAYARSKTTKIVVTDKRVYGIAVAKMVDLPLDSISAVSTTRLYRGLSVATSSGRIEFYGLDNRADVYNAINKLLIERQNKSKVIIAHSESTHDKQDLSGADELKKYKELFDQGIITEDEFNAKKRKILGI